MEVLKEQKGIRERDCEDEVGNEGHVRGAVDRPLCR